MTERNMGRSDQAWVEAAKETASVLRDQAAIAREQAALARRRAASLHGLAMARRHESEVCPEEDAQRRWRLSEIADHEGSVSEQEAKTFDSEAERLDSEAATAESATGAARAAVRGVMLGTSAAEDR